MNVRNLGSGINKARKAREYKKTSLNRWFRHDVIHHVASAPRLQFTPMGTSGMCVWGAGVEGKSLMTN